jgi:CP family cyanate transporter-like MFS transporter
MTISTADTSKQINKTYGRILASGGIILVALNLRAAITALSPIYAEIGKSIPISTMAQGILGALPPLCFALFGALTPVLVRKLGLEKSLLLAMLLTCAGQIGRSFSGSIIPFGLMYLICLAGMGMANVLLPPVIKTYFPDKIGLMTGIYTALTAVSSGLPSLIAVPVTASAGWRFSTGIWASVALVASLPWIALVNHHNAPSFRSPTRTGRLWRSPVAWSVAIVFGIGALNTYAMISWLPKILVDTAGVSQATAGTMLFCYTVIGFPHGLIIPALLARSRHPLRIIALASSCLLIGYIGLICFPGLDWVWIFPAGLGLMYIPIGLTLINLRSRTEQGAAQLSGFVQGCGYLLGACGPFLTGSFHTLTGGWIPSLLFLIITALAAFIAGIFAVRNRFIEDPSN